MTGRPDSLEVTDRGPVRTLALNRPERRNALSLDLMTELTKAGGGDIPVMVGGLIHPEDVDHLKGLGVAVVFGPDSTTDAILDFVSGLAVTP